MTLERAYLNKIYRAVHDGVCPKCGDELRAVVDTCVCIKGGCGFKVTDYEMIRMREVIAEWGAPAVEYFEEWRKQI